MSVPFKNKLVIINVYDNILFNIWNYHYRGLVRPPDEGVIEDEERPRMSVSDAEGGYQEVTPKTYQIIEKEAATGM